MMPKAKNIRTAVIGCGNMARHHVRQILAHFEQTAIPVVCEPSPAAYEEMAEIFLSAGRELPDNEPDLNRLLALYHEQLDTAFIVTPHVYHHDQAKACLEAGLDVLLEKPMAMNAAEARSLIETRDRSGRHLVVAFPGSLSPQVRKAAAMLKSRELGVLLTIDAVVWQGWRAFTDGTWRQRPELSGGGFLFDTGAHMLNTVADLAGEDFTEVAAWFDYRRRPVDILAVIMGRLKSGVLVTMHGCGDTIPSCSSDVRLFCTQGILRTGVWGERLEVQYSEGEGWKTVDCPGVPGVWGQFLEVRSGRIPNPSPPEVGLRMAYLWDAIQASAEHDGVPVKIDQAAAEVPVT